MIKNWKNAWDTLLKKGYIASEFHDLHCSNVKQAIALGDRRSNMQKVLPVIHIELATLFNSHSDFDKPHQTAEEMFDFLQEKNREIIIFDRENTIKPYEDFFNKKDWESIKFEKLLEESNKKSLSKTYVPELVITSSITNINDHDLNILNKGHISFAPISP